MKVFISWSGDRSRKIAEVLSTWLPTVIQIVTPYFSPNDISKGSRWSSEIAKELEECQIGLLCMVEDNIHSDWIMFEAGALSKKLDKSKVIPVLFNIEPTDLKGPLTQFQCAKFSKNEIKKIIRTINNELTADFRLTDYVIDSTFNMWWPKLEEEIKIILSEKKVKSIIRSDRELIEEILLTVRMQTHHKHSITTDEDEAIMNLYNSYDRIVKDVVDNKHTQAYYDVLQEIGDIIESLINNSESMNLLKDFYDVSTLLRRAYENASFMDKLD